MFFWKMIISKVFFCEVYCNILHAKVSHREWTIGPTSTIEKSLSSLPVMMAKQILYA